MPPREDGVDEVKQFKAMEGGSIPVPLLAAHSPGDEGWQGYLLPRCCRQPDSILVAQGAWLASSPG